MSKTVLFQVISTQFSSIWPIDRTVSAATTPGQSGPRNDGSEGVLHILQSFSITGASPSDCLVSYRWWGGTPLQRSSRCILEPQPTRQHILPYTVSLCHNSSVWLDTRNPSSRNRYKCIYIYTQEIRYSFRSKWTDPSMHAQLKHERQLTG